MKWAALGCFLIVTGAAGGEQTPKFDPFAETPSPKPATTRMIAILRPGGFRDMAEAHLRAQNRRFVSNDDAEMSAYFVGYMFGVLESVPLDGAAGRKISKCVEVFGPKSLVTRVASFVHDLPTAPETGAGALMQAHFAMAVICEPIKSQ